MNTLTQAIYQAAARPPQSIKYQPLFWYYPEVAEHTDSAMFGFSPWDSPLRFDQDSTSIVIQNW